MSVTQSVFLCRLPAHYDCLSNCSFIFAVLLAHNEVQEFSSYIGKEGEILLTSLGFETCYIFPMRIVDLLSTAPTIKRSVSSKIMFQLI